MKIDSLFLSNDATYNEVLEVIGTLELDPNKSITIITSKNIVVTGKLISKPAWPNIHTIRFINVNEDKFVGGGMDVLDTDIGLWVMGTGKLDLQGEKKTGWSRAAFGIKAGETVFAVEDAAGWKLGDELIITPTASGATACDERKIVNVNGNIITVDKPLTDHPAVVSKAGIIWTAEVGNLTRNLRIEGTATGQSHIFIHSTAVQIVQYTAIRYMGPNRNQGGGTEKEFVLGRYGLHFHHCDHIPGSIVEGNVIRDTGSHSYVPHGSHGILIRDNIAYNVTRTAYWYDLGHKSHNLIWEKNLAAIVKYVPRSIDMDLKETDPDTPPEFSSSGFIIGMGDNNIFRYNVVVGTMGDPRSGGGYNWEANDEGIPGFRNNVAHNCHCGGRIWQNTENNHVIDGLTVYNCLVGIFHGAYANSYTYKFCDIINCAFIFHSASVNTSRLRLLNSNLDTIIIEGSPLPGMLPILIRDCNYKSLIDQAGPPDEPGSHSVDIVNCTGTNKVDPSAAAAEVLRVQPKNGQPVRITNKGTTNIAAFAPTMWGSGTGLLGEYYNDATFSKKVFERIDQFVMFPEWGNVVHYLITSTIMSARWTGFIEPQFSESYTFNLASAGTATLWLDGKKVIGPVALIAGKKYAVKIEFFNTDDSLRGGMNFLWRSPSLDKFNNSLFEYVPQSQLYPPITLPDPDPEPPKPNQGPTADAGSAESISVSFSLKGKGSDVDGTIVSYLWQKLSGPDCTIVNPSAVETTAINLKPGDYIFQLTVTDDKGAKGTATVTKSLK